MDSLHMSLKASDLPSIFIILFVTQLSSNLPGVKKIAHGIWLQKINIGIRTKCFAQKFTMNSDSKSFRRLVLFLVLKLDKNNRKSAKLILIYVLMILRLVINYIALKTLYPHSSTQSLYIDSREKGSPQNLTRRTRAAKWRGIVLGDLFLTYSVCGYYDDYGHYF